ncbi:MAG: thiamine phosphate synthase [Proteobacteria bacterium]|nr:thiamine phosphate synthase [Pseudomonadota bacterium]
MEDGPREEGRVKTRTSRLARSKRDPSRASRSPSYARAPTSAAAPTTAPGPVRFYLVTPPLDATTAIHDQLRAALGAADVAAVLLRLAPGDEHTLVDRVAAIAAIVQGAGAALILDDHHNLVERAGADGAHVAGIGALATILPALKPARIAGCGGLTNRHEAMVAGDMGADYVMFGEPGGNGVRPTFGAIAELISWWAELMQVPCVGYAASFEEVAYFARARAEFVAVGDLIFADPRGAAAALAQAASQLTVPEARP